MAHNRARERGPASTKEPEPPAQPPTGVRVPVPTEVGVRSQASSVAVLAEAALANQADLDSEYPSFSDEIHWHGINQIQVDIY